MAGFFKRLIGLGDPAPAGNQPVADPPVVNEREDIAAKLAVDRLNWLLDAPLFIDEPLVRRLFDAVARPQFEVHSRVVGELNEEARSRLTGGEASATYKGGLSFLIGSVEAGGKLKHERGTSAKTGRSSNVTEQRVDTPGRKLEELAAVYLDRYPDRVVFMNSAGKATTFDGRPLDLRMLEKEAETPPRMLAFLDLVPESRIIPMACELQSGETILLFLKYIEKLWKKGDPKPIYPAPELKGAALRAAWQAYWKALAAPFRSRVAMEIIEQAGAESAEGHGRLGWIDFRVPIGSKGDAMHLHAVPNGEYHAGTFGYNFVRRAHNVGVRIVGTLRAGPGTDMNVLAIFDN